MLTDTARRPTDAASFVLRGVAGSLGVFGLLRLNWTEAHLVLPLTRLQGGARGASGRHADDVRRGHAGVQRRRRAGALSRGRPRLSREVANASWPAPVAAPP